MTMYDNVIAVCCTDCGTYSGTHAVQCESPEDLQRHTAFLRAFRCSACWVARQQRRIERQAGGVSRSLAAPKPTQPVLFNPPTQTNDSQTRTSVYSEAPPAVQYDQYGREVRPRAYRPRYADQEGNVWEQVGTVSRRPVQRP